MKSSTKYWKIATNLAIALLLILFCVFLLPKLIGFFMPFLIGWVIAMIANPLVRFLEKRVKIVRKAGSAFVIILVIAVVVLIGYTVIANLTQQVIGFIKELPDTWKALQVDMMRVGNNLSVYYEKLPEDMQIRLLELQKDYSTYFGNAFSEMGAPTMTAAGNFAKNIPLVLISVIMTLISSYLFVAERDDILNFVRSHTTQSVKDRFALVYESLRQAVGGYFKAQFKIMLVVAIILLIGFSILHVEYSILIAILIALLDFFPFFGTGTVMIPWAVIKILSGDYKMAIGLLIIWGVSQLVRQIIQPKIVGDSMGMPPIPTMVLLYVGFRVGGAWGLIIAVPVGMIVYNLYRAGIFSNTIKSIKILVEDVNKFRKIDEP